ncbi:DUF2500 domain-containing protein [Paenibacillus pinihumi]|uniref:DUF2500 domain-containing protein n=1 Tax=Paenibacillus pinihumi TaxID=669462 RepID=UPI0004227174|nr:DUF2500 domain-containing protein [Paenibacillus pinihumi]
MHVDFPSGGVGGFDFIFNLFPVIFVIIVIIIIVKLLMGGAKYVQNASSPRESHYSRIVAKRTEVRSTTNHHHGENGAMHPTHSSRTYYYITLEFDNGSRKEFLDVKNLYGLVAEGDNGYASIQGDWIVAFERQPMESRV